MVQPVQKGVFGRQLGLGCPGKATRNKKPRKKKWRRRRGGGGEEEEEEEEDGWMDVK